MIYGDRIILRAVEREDLPDYVRWLNDPAVLEYFGNHVPLSLVQEEKWYDDMLRDPSFQAFAVECESLPRTSGPSTSTKRLAFVTKGAGARPSSATVAITTCCG